MLNSRSRWILPIPSNFRQGCDPSVMTVRFPSREVKFLSSLARELWQFCEWNLTNIGLHRLADRVISNAKKLNVVMPVNESNFCYGSYRPVTVCVKDVSRLREYAQQNHIFFIRTVSKAWPSVLVLEWWANKIIRNKTESACPYVQYGSNGSNLHVEQNQFITILRNLHILSLANL